MKSSRNIRHYFRIAAEHRGILSIFTVGIVTVIVISGVATAQSPNASSPISAKGGTTAEDKSIHPFHVKVPEAALADMRRRIAATRWPDRETVNDRSQGVQLAKIQELVRYWGTDYDWRKAEAKLNALPEFVTTIDGVDIQFAWVRSRHPNAMPLIMTHGWPGSIFELLKVIGPLTDPTAYGGRAEDAFDLVLPSMPGFGFSGKPRGPGWNPDHIARAWAELMHRLGYKRYVAQGGDWGSVITDTMAHQTPAGLIGIQVNMPATAPPEVAKALSCGAPAPPGLSAEEKAAYEQLNDLYQRGTGFATIMVTRPETIGYSLADSPAGLLHGSTTSLLIGRTPAASPSYRSRAMRCSTISRSTGSQMRGSLLRGSTGRMRITPTTLMRWTSPSLPQ